MDIERKEQTEKRAMTQSMGWWRWKCPCCGPAAKTDERAQAHRKVRRAVNQELHEAVKEANMPLPMTNLRAIMPELEAAERHVLAIADIPGLADMNSDDITAEYNRRQDAYNEVAQRAALALWEDTKDRNSKSSIMMVFGTPNREGRCPGPGSFKVFLRDKE